MKDKLYIIDNIICDNFFQKLSDRVYKAFGISCLSIAKFFIYPYMITNLFLAYEISPIMYLVSLVMYVAVPILALIYYLDLHMLEKKYKNIAVEAEVNPNRLKMADDRVRTFIRLIIMLVSLIPIFFSDVYIWKEIRQYKMFIIALNLAFSSQFLLFYFMSCTPLPPGTSKIRLMLKNFQEKLSEVLTPEPCTVATKRTCCHLYDWP